MCDFGRIFQKIVQPYVDKEDNTLDEALNRFVRYYEQNKLFDHYTHGTGPGVGRCGHKYVKNVSGPLCEYQVGQKHSRRFEYTVCIRCLRKQTLKNCKYGCVQSRTG